MLATLIQSAPVYDAAWWLAALWFFRTLCLWSFFWAGCPCCGVATCTGCSGSTPSQIEAAISGFTDGSGGPSSCSTCDETYNGTFVLDNGLACLSGSLVADPCGWYYFFSSGACVSSFGGNLEHLLLGMNLSGGSTFVALSYWRTGDVFCNKSREWRRSQLTTPAQVGVLDCASMVAYEVADLGTGGGEMAGGTVCNHDLSSAFLTAV